MAEDGGSTDLNEIKREVRVIADRMKALESIAPAVLQLTEHQEQM